MDIGTNHWLTKVWATPFKHQWISKGPTSLLGINACGTLMIEERQALVKDGIGYALLWRRRPYPFVMAFHL
jgi:hypothetical protein